MIDKHNTDNDSEDESTPNENENLEAEHTTDTNPIDTENSIADPETPGQCEVPSAEEKMSEKEMRHKKKKKKKKQPELNTKQRTEGTEQRGQDEPLKRETATATLNRFVRKWRQQKEKEQVLQLIDQMQDEKDWIEVSKRMSKITKNEYARAQWRLHKEREEDARIRKSQVLQAQIAAQPKQQQSIQTDVKVHLYHNEEGEAKIIGRALLDTGANRSFVSVDICDEWLQRKMGRFKVQEHYPVNFVTANGQVLNPTGNVRITASVGLKDSQQHELTFIVATDMPAGTIIIGRDTLQKIGLYRLIDLSRLKVELRDTVLNAIELDPEATQRNEQITPSTEESCSCKISDSTDPCICIDEEVKTNQVMRIHEEEGYEGIGEVRNRSELPLITKHHQEDTRKRVEQIVKAMKKQGIDEGISDKLADVLLSSKATREQLTSEPANLPEFKIELIDTATPTMRRPVRMSPVRKAFVEEQIAALLRQQVIQPSASEWASAVVLAKKKDGTLRLCIDFRHVNKQTKSQPHPIPRIEEILDNLKGAKYFSTIDLRSGFWQIAVDEHMRHVTGFSTSFGHYHWNRLPFGLKNATSHFQRVLSRVFSGVDWVTPYVDDLIITATTQEQMLERVKLVFDLLGKHNLIVNVSKCEFFKKEIKYLGYVVNTEGIKADGKKVKALLDYPRPRTTKQLSSFLGLVRYFGRFIPYLPDVIQPMQLIMLAQPQKKKSRTIDDAEWTDKVQQSFDQAKIIMTTPPTLRYPDFTKTFHIFTDAASAGTGALLAQMDGDHYYPIAYGSTTFQGAEKCYPAAEQEALAIVRHTTRWLPYISDAPFVLHTDSKACTHIQEAQYTNNRIKRWVLALQELDYTVVHIPGHQNVLADILSRMVEPEERLKDRNAQLQIDQQLQQMNILSKPKSEEKVLFTMVQKLKKMPTISIKEQKFWENPQLYDQLKSELMSVKQQKEQNKLAEIQVKEDCDPMSYIKQKVVDIQGGRVLFHGREVPHPTLRRAVVVKTHAIGHFGAEATEQTIRLKYWFPGLSKLCREITSNCIQCLRFDTTQVRITRRHFVAQPPNRPFQKIGVDLIGPLGKTVKGNNYILSVTDHFSRWVTLSPLQNKQTETVAEALLQYFLMFGPPEVMLSDRGSEFVSKVSAELCKFLQLQHILNAGYHPQTNSIAEKTNHTAIRILSKVAQVDTTNWDDWLPFVAFCMRSRVSPRTGWSPYMIVMGQQPNMFDALEQTREEDQQRMTEVLDRMRKQGESEQMQISPEEAEKMMQYDEDELIWQQLEHMRNLVGVLRPQVAAHLQRTAQKRQDVAQHEALQARGSPNYLQIGDYVQIVNQKRTKLQPKFTGCHKVVKVSQTGNVMLKTMIGTQVPYHLYNPERLRKIPPKAALEMIESELRKNAVLAVTTKSTPKEEEVVWLYGTAQDSVTPTEQLQQWIRQKTGGALLDLDLMAAESKNPIANHGVTNFQLHAFEKVKQANSIWVNPPFSQYYWILPWLERHARKKKIWILYPKYCEKLMSKYQSAIREKHTCTKRDIPYMLKNAEGHEMPAPEWNVSVARLEF